MQQDVQRNLDIHFIKTLKLKTLLIIQDVEGNSLTKRPFKEFFIL